MSAEVDRMIRSSRVLAGVAALSFLAACGGSSPTSPTPSAPARVGGIFLTPTSVELPVGGGQADLAITTALSPTMGGIAPNVELRLTASSGALSAATVRTDSQGRATVTWSGSASATVTAAAGDVSGMASILVAVPPPPPPAPVPAPAPHPQPDPTPPPQPTPAPRPPFNVFLGVSGPQPVGAPAGTFDAGAVLTYAAGMNSNGAPMPASASWAWDLDGDGTIDRVTTGPTPQPDPSAPITHAFGAPGVYHPTVTMTAPGFAPIASSPITVIIR